MSRREPGAVVIVGYEGRMGRFASELLASDFERVGGVGRDDDLSMTLKTIKPRLAIDFTAAGLGFEHAKLMLENGVPALVGTSGVTPDQVRELDELARAHVVGGLVVPNFSLGIWLQQRLALEAARYCEDLEIIEEHHQSKLDAPSGTALDTARLLARGDGEVPIHSVRLPGLYSNQTVVFGATGEVLRLTHETYGVEAFGPGIRAAARYVLTARGVASGLGHALPAASDSSS